MLPTEVAWTCQFDTCSEPLIHARFVKVLKLHEAVISARRLGIHYMLCHRGNDKSPSRGQQAYEVFQLAEILNNLSA